MKMKLNDVRRFDLQKCQIGVVLQHELGNNFNEK